MAGFKRKVFYLGGFDPRGVRFYHALMDEQLTRYAARSGETVTLSTRRKPGPERSDWTIRNETNGATTDYTFLVWDDIVRAAWISNPLALGWRAVKAYRANLKHLDFATGRKLGKGPLITLAYPAAFTVLIPLLLAIVIGLIMAIWLPGAVATLIGLVAGIGLAVPFLKRVHAPWLLRFFVFNSELGGGEAHPELERRLDTFADMIAPELDGDWDEVLLVSHSNGSILAVPLMVRLLQRRQGLLPTKFALVTMGHCIPLVGCRRDAARFRDQLRTLAAHEFRWIDIGSPPDGAAYSGVNPMLIVTADTRPEVTLLSPRFFRFYDPGSYSTSYAKKYEMHFNYLRTGDRISPIDYPSLMTAARPIEASIAEFRTIP